MFCNWVLELSCILYLINYWHKNVLIFVSFIANYDPVNYNSPRNLCFPPYLTIFKCHWNSPYDKRYSCGIISNYSIPFYWQFCTSELVLVVCKNCLYKRYGQTGQTGLLRVSTADPVSIPITIISCRRHHYFMRKTRLTLNIYNKLLLQMCCELKKLDLVLWFGDMYTWLNNTLGFSLIFNTIRWKTSS